MIKSVCSAHLSTKKDSERECEQHVEVREGAACELWAAVKESSREALARNDTSCFLPTLSHNGSFSMETPQKRMEIFLAVRM